MPPTLNTVTFRPLFTVTRSADGNVQRSSATGGRVITHPFTTQGASPPTGQVCFGRRFIQKNKIPDLHPVKLSPPFFPPGGDDFLVWLAGAQRFL